MSAEVDNVGRASMKQHMPSNVSTVVLTYNEEMNLPACLESLDALNGEVIVVDSGSTDQTLDIAERYGAKVYRHDFGVWASGQKKINWALDTIPMRGDWILRLDADERLTPELARELAELSSREVTNCTGFFIKRRMYFMGRWIRHGGWYPVWILRLWRKGKARCDSRIMDEQMVLLEGQAGWLKHDLMDWDHKGLAFRVEKINRYSNLYARLMSNGRDGTSSIFPTSPWGAQLERRQWIKDNVYAKCPKFFRSLVYFLFSYIVLLGFLDGKAGLVFHVLYGFWYRFLSDAKVLEMEQCRQRSSISSSE